VLKGGTTERLFLKLEAFHLPGVVSISVEVTLAVLVHFMIISLLSCLVSSSVGIYAHFIELVSLILELLFEVLYALWIKPFASTSQGGRRWLHPPGWALGVQ